MKKSILLFLIILGFNSLLAQINNNVQNPGIAPNSGVQPPPSGAPQTTGPDFQSTTPYMQTVPSATTPNIPGQIPNTQTTTPQIQIQPNITTPNPSGTDNSIYTNPTNTLTPGAPTSPPKNK
ncbi:MAG TPA: hypothetical protein VN698_09910 [Bacteroidia bacterium]|nr:hypothetical protein [Bacteroidia bacterium]